MKALKTAIYNEFKRDLGAGTHHAIYTDCSGRLYFQIAPQGANYPYVVFHLDSIRADYTFNSEINDILVVFDIWADDMSSSNIDDYFTHLRACFDDANLTVSGYADIRFRFDWAQQLVEQNEGDKENIWRYIVQYRVLLREN